MKNPDQALRRLGPTAQKIMVLLLAGFALSLNKNPNKYFRIIRRIPKEFEKIDKYTLHRNIRNLYKAKLIDGKDYPDGSTALHLTDNGKKRALHYKLDDIKIAPMKKWDRKWRIIIFDIPEKRKKARDALSRSLKNAGFYRLQKSTFIHPFECKDEVDFVIEFFNLRPFVRFIIAEHLDNELHLKHHFNLL